MNGVIKRSDPADDYELLQKVGHGTYGEVYKARHVRSGELAAVKAVKLEAGDNFTVIQQEIVVLMDCKHPNIISYYGSYLRRNKLWIVMEYCSGGSLQDIYQMTGPLTELQIAFVCRETLEGLKYLHQLGKVHRDVKGANILLTHSGDIKLADFGVAAQITATIGKRKSFIGTPYWMAPEVANVEQRGGYGVECDVWAVGITAIELAEMQPPFFDLHPMQVLYLMTKSNYKPPKLKNKKKWSATFHDFVRICLTKNPKKRPAPAKLLTSHAFVVGALSSRLIRELLDLVNNPGCVAEKQQADATSIIDDMANLNSFGHDISSKRDFYHDEDTIQMKDNVELQVKSNRLLSATRIQYVDDEDENNEEHINDPNLAEESRCQVSSITTKGSNVIRPISMFVPRVADAPADVETSLPAADVSTRPAARNERSMSLGAAFGGAPKHSPFFAAAAQFGGNRFGAVGAVRKRRNFTPSAKSDQLYSHDDGEVEPLTARPQTIFGLVPTPQVSMGACFCHILKNCIYQVNWCSTWTHPANYKQYLIVGAEEGIFTLDLCELHNNTLTLIHERKCSWLCVIGDVMIALQGKTPYLYRHDILQLMQQQLITQKITKTMTRIPEKYKPRVLLTTIRMPETRDCFKCSVEESAIDGNIYMACAIPNALLLFQWYRPLSRFIMMKRVDTDFDVGARALRSLPQFLAPFSLIFGSSSSTTDFPIICIGVCRTNDVCSTATDSVDASRRFTKLRLNFVDFNDTGKLKQFLARSSANFFDFPTSLSQCQTPDDGVERPSLGGLNVGQRIVGVETLIDNSLAAAVDPFDDSTLLPFARRALNLTDRDRLAVTCLKQLDRDTLFVAYENKILITDLRGNEKITDLMTTSFTFDFNIDFAVPLPDSVLVFHKHGVQGRSFFRGFVTQDIQDTSKTYKVVGNDSLITLRCRQTLTTVNSEEIEDVSNLLKKPSGLSENGCDLCILTGHISTLTSK